MSDWKPTKPENPDFKCRKCGSNEVEYLLHESSCGGFEDYHYRCPCGNDWWVERQRRMTGANDMTNPPLERTDPVERAELLELLELGGDYAADVFNGFHDKTSPCALRVERNLERFNRAHAALAMSAKAMGGE